MVNNNKRRREVHGGPPKDTVKSNLDEEREHKNAPSKSRAKLHRSKRVNPSNEEGVRAKQLCNT